jgi:hypothetical protein
MRKSAEHTTFDRAMNTILRADPVKVKAAVNAQVEASTAEREARGESKRGRKPKSISISVPVSDAKT